MKAPLRYQLTAHDCGPTSFSNALGFLLDVEEFPPEVLTFIYDVTLDRYIGPDAARGGTSGAALAYLSWWLNDYARRTGLPIRTRAIAGEEVSLGEGSVIAECLREGGAAVVECCLGCDHYVLLTGFDGERVKVFDPFCYRDGVPACLADVRFVGVKRVDDAPFSHNYLVERPVFEEPQGTAYSLNALCGRDAVLFWRTDEENVQ